MTDGAVQIRELTEEGAWEVVLPVSEADHDVSDPGITLVLSYSVADRTWTAEAVQPDGYRKSLQVLSRPS